MPTFLGKGSFCLIGQKTWLVITEGEEDAYIYIQYMHVDQGAVHGYEASKTVSESELFRSIQ